MHSARNWISVSLLSALAFVACSEAADLAPDAGEETTSDAGTSTGNDGGAITTNDSGGVTPISDAGTGGVVLNEVCGKGDNWVELFNPTTGAIDVSSYAVADTEKDGGGPKLSDAVSFPSGTVLSPNSYLVVAGTNGDAGSTCPDGGQSYCFPATWGISNKSGESVYVLDPHGAIAEQADYPANTLTDGQTWGRLPNGSGSFTTTAATPGAANKAP
jgi:hypothetical protein